MMEQQRKIEEEKKLEKKDFYGHEKKIKIDLNFRRFKVRIYKNR